MVFFIQKESLFFYFNFLTNKKTCSIEQAVSRKFYFTKISSMSFNIRLAAKTPPAVFQIVSETL